MEDLLFAPAHSVRRRRTPTTRKLHVADKFTGDGSTALFGALIAHEDRAQRAWLLRYVIRWTLHLFLASVFVQAAPLSPTRAANPLTGLPANFIDEAIVTGLLSPRAFAFTPDGRILIVERGTATSTDINVAGLRVFKNGALLPTRAYNFSVCGDGERGLLGLTLDPGFASNGYIYVYYTRPGSPTRCGYNTYSNGQPGPRNRIARLTLVGDVVSGTEKVLVDNIPSDSGIHNAGDLHFGADGYLYASVGNSNLESPLAPSTQPMSQDVTRLAGKILRILPSDVDPDGYTTSGNPFDTAPGAWKCGPLANLPPPLPGSGSGPCKEIFAYGLRNPFRFAIQPGASVPFAGDVGGGAWEEVDEIIAGGNYGWPNREGPCGAGVLCQPPYTQPPGLQNPIYAYSHGTVGGGAAIIVGDFYRGPLMPYPQQYWDNLFLADFVFGWMRRIVRDPSGVWSAPEPYFATGGEGLVGLRMGPDGNLYYLTTPNDQSANSELRRIRYQAADSSPPLAQIAVSPSGAAPGQPFTFSAAGSHDPGNHVPLTYEWNFGDGSVMSGTDLITVTHTYVSGPPKAMTATLTVVNSVDLASTPVTATVYANDPPPTATIDLTNTTSPTRTLYYAGDTWAFATGDARDGGGQPIPPGNLSWEVRFHHQQHSHPFLSGLVGAQGVFTPSTNIETDPVQWYRVTLTVRDALGQTSSIVRDVLPATATVTLDTNPSGGLVTVVGFGTNPGPWSVTRVVGINIGISVPSPQQIGSQTYTFASWSNGGAQSQNISVPPNGGTYTAAMSSSAPGASPTPTATRSPTASPTAGSPVTTTITAPVAAASDDVNQDGSSFDSGSASVWLGTGASTTSSYTGLRFTNLAIPAGATINSARLQVYSNQTQWLRVSMSLAAEAIGNSPAFSASSLPSQRTLTTRKVVHSSDTQWLANTWYDLDEIAPILQEVVSRADWQSGNSLSLILTGTGGAWGRKFVTSLDASPITAPKLIINFTSSVPTSSPSATAPPANTATSAPSATRTTAPTATATRTATQAPVATATSTRAPTATATNRPSSTPTATATRTQLASATSTRTATRTATKSATPTPTPTATPVAPTTVTLTVQIGASANDANQDGSSFDSGSASVWLGTGASTTSSYAGLRFPNLAIPAGATINSARLQVYSNQTQWLRVSMSLAAEAIGNSPTFSGSSLPSQRMLTTRKVVHSSDTQWLANTWNGLDEIAPVLQEVVSRPDWQSGNSLSIILTGTGGAWGRKFVAGFDGSALNAPKLVVVYTTP